MRHSLQRYMRGLIAGAVGDASTAWPAGCAAGPTNPSIGTRSAPAVTGIRIEPATADVGQLPWGTRIPIEFVLTNDGEAPATVIDLRTSCDCTAAVDDYVGLKLAPGESQVVHFILDAGDTPGSRWREVAFTFDEGPIARGDTS